MTLDTTERNRYTRREEDPSKTGSAWEYAVNVLFRQKKNTRVENQYRAVYERTFPFLSSRENLYQLNELARPNKSLTITLSVPCQRNGDPAVPRMPVNCELKGGFEGRKYKLLVDGTVEKVSHHDEDLDFDMTTLLREYVDPESKPMMPTIDPRVDNEPKSH